MALCLQQVRHGRRLGGYIGGVVTLITGQRPPTADIFGIQLVQVAGPSTVWEV